MSSITDITNIIDFRPVVVLDAEGRGITHVKHLISTGNSDLIYEFWKEASETVQRVFWQRDGLFLMLDLQLSNTVKGKDIGLFVPTRQLRKTKERLKKWFSDNGVTDAVFRAKDRKLFLTPEEQIERVRHLLQLN